MRKGNKCISKSTFETGVQYWSNSIFAASDQYCRKEDKRLISENYPSNTEIHVPYSSVIRYTSYNLKGSITKLRHCNRFLHFTGRCRFFSHKNLIKKHAREKRTLPRSTDLTEAKTSMHRTHQPDFGILYWTRHTLVVISSGFPLSWIDKTLGFSSEFAGIFPSF